MPDTHDEDDEHGKPKVTRIYGKERKKWLQQLDKKKIACLPTNLGVHMNSFKRVRAFQIELEFGSVGFWGEGKTGVPGEKPLGARERTNNKLNLHKASTPGVEPWLLWWEASAFTTAPFLAPQGQEIKELDEFIYLGGGLTRTWKSDSQKLGVHYVRLNTCCAINKSEAV